MEHTIQILLNGYEYPTVLSSTRDCKISFLNNKWKNFGYQPDALLGTQLYDHLKNKDIIEHKVLWTDGKNTFEIHEEKLTLDEKKYILSVLVPVHSDQMVDLIELQKEMAKRIAHKFSSTLQGISGYLELLEMQEPNNKHKKYIDAVMESRNSIFDVLKRLQNMAQDIEPYYSTFDVQSFIENILLEFPPGQRKFIEVHFDEDTTKLCSDYILLKQIIKELLKNAFTHTSRLTDPVRLDVAEHCILVTNLTTPIPKKLKKKIFYPFFTSKAKLFGLGLTQAFMYAQQLGCQLQLISNSVTEGITFQLKM